jgi:hypothetical protein
MRNLILEAIYHRYRCQKRDAEQVIDFFQDIEAYDGSVNEIYEKVDKALDDWVDADSKMSALLVMTGNYPSPFERETPNARLLMEQVFGPQAKV